MMETCSLKDISRLLLIVLLALCKTLCAGSFTASTDSDHAKMTEYYPVNKTDLEEITASPTEVVSIKILLGMGTTDGGMGTTDGGMGTTDGGMGKTTDGGMGTTDGGKAAAESSNAFSALSKGQEPRTETNSGTSERLSIVKDAPKHSVQTGATLDTESWESPSQTASTYMFSTISRAGERTLLSVITNSTSVYTEKSNSSETVSLSSVQGYQNSSRTISQNTSDGLQTSSFSSSQVSSQTSSRTHDSYQTPLQTDSFSQSSSEHSSETSSQSSSQTLEHTLSEGSQMSSRVTSLTSSVGSTSKVSYESTQTSSQTSPRTFTWDGLSKNTASQGWSDKTTSSEDGQPDTTTNSHKTLVNIFQNKTGYTNVTNKSPDVYSRGTPNATLPFPMADESTDVTHSVYPHEGGTSYSRDPTSSVPPALSTEGSMSETSHPGQETATLERSTEITSELSTLLQHTSSNEETETTLENAEGSTVKDVITPNTEKPARTTGAPSSVHWMTTQRSEFTEGNQLYRSSTQSLASMPPNVQNSHSPTARTQTPVPTTPATTRTTPEPQTWNRSSEDVSSKTAVTSSQSFSGAATTSHLEVSTVTPRGTTDHSQTPTLAYKHTAPPRTTIPYTTGGFKGTTSTTEAHQTPKISTTVQGFTCGPRQCLNGGECLTGERGGPYCKCLPAWTGQDCSLDVDECVSGPCPPSSKCVNTRGSFSCECQLGYDLENGRTCTLARTFLGIFRLSGVNTTHPSSAKFQEIQREILQLLNASLSSLNGYGRSTLQTDDRPHISAVHTFSKDAQVTHKDVVATIQGFLSNCSDGVSHCGVVQTHRLSYNGRSLCQAQKVQCDSERTICNDSNGISFCECRSGYFKHSSDDLSCRECGDGLKLYNGTCVPCTFGFGGFNCENFYKLIAVVVAPIGGVLLFILLITLIVMCCRKDRNDINKIIFKSGDFQMSPYNEYPKTNRMSGEWGREAIEMQENGSTKNLLQMTDIYYSGALRNPDWSSRQSCIYPAQWNPSFISDDTRRRDYF